jgi:hypothetical protein
LSLPDRLPDIAAKPQTVLLLPAILAYIAPLPPIVLLLPVVVYCKVPCPKAVSSVPVVRAFNEYAPTPVVIYVADVKVVLPAATPRKVFHEWGAAS